MTKLCLIIFTITRFNEGIKPTLQVENVRFKQGYFTFEGSMMTVGTKFRKM
jgi:hypothetical protein